MLRHLETQNNRRVATTTSYSLKRVPNPYEYHLSLEYTLGSEKYLFVKMMDSLENDLFALPDYEHTEDERFPPLPPPRSPGAGDDDAGDLLNGDDWTANLPRTQAEEAPKTVKRTVKRPQPKLDAQRLSSKRGLPALRHIFDDTKFKGKGHEAEDLKTLLRHMENWAHRLFPKLQFEEFLSRLETLGNKKQVQTCLKRIRMDLPIVHEDFTSDEVVVQMEDNGLDLPSEDFAPLPESSPLSLTQTGMVDLSEETRQRIETNRLLALERRMSRKHAQTSSQDTPTLPAISQISTDLDEIPVDLDDLLEDVELATTQPETEREVDPVETEREVDPVETEREVDPVETEREVDPVETELAVAKSPRIEPQIAIDSHTPEQSHID